MQIILSDHNCEGHARKIFNVLVYDGDWLKLVPMKLQWFCDVGLSERASDETVWPFCQEHGYILLTGNRRTDDEEESLEYVTRRLVTSTSLPVLYTLPPRGRARHKTSWQLVLLCHRGGGRVTKQAGSLFYFATERAGASQNKPCPSNEGSQLVLRIRPKLVPQTRDGEVGNFCSSLYGLRFHDLHRHSDCRLLRN